MNIELRSELLKAFAVNGVTGGKLVPILLAERAYGSMLNREFRGYHELMDSASAFYMETLEASCCALAKLKENIRNEYQILVITHLANFRSFRSAENLLITVYPVSAVVFLRDLKDRAFVIGAVAHGDASLNEVLAVDETLKHSKLNSVQDRLKALKAIKNVRRTAESKVFQKMMERNDNNTKDQISLWNELMHLEVHGARGTTATCDFDFLSGKQNSLRFEPLQDLNYVSHYCKSAYSIAWMIHRTLPYLQTKESHFNDGWAERWKLLDDCFNTFLTALKQPCPDFANAILKLISNCFPFTPETTLFGCHRKGIPA